MTVVDQQAYDALECNRCGACCELFYPSLSGEPLDLIVEYGKAEANCLESMEGHPEWSTFKTMMWYGEMQPIRGKHSWGYSCGQFSRDINGLGVCGIQDDKPVMCNNFPNGLQILVEHYPKCTWAQVELIDFDIVLDVVYLSNDHKENHMAEIDDTELEKALDG